MYFKNIKKHSKKIKNIKFILLVLGSLIILHTAFSLLKNPSSQRLQMSYMESIDESGVMKIKDPFIYGFDNKNQAFKMHAKQGEQHKNNKDIHFKTVSGEIELLKDMSKFHISSNECELSTDKNLLFLTGDVIITSTTGYKAIGDEIYISLENQDIYSNKPINIKSKTRHAKSNTFYYESKNKTITLEGNVITVID